MKWLLGALALMLASMAMTLLVSKDNGYVLIGYGVWTVEMSFALYVLLNLLFYALFTITLRTGQRLWAIPQRVRDWNERRLAGRARHFLTRGLIKQAEGEWEASEKDLIRYADKSDTPLLNYLAAARAAQALGAHERRDAYLLQAHESVPSADVAVGLTQAELQFAHTQLEQALATLTHLRHLAPKHRQVLQMLQSVYERLGDWKQLSQLMPELRKHKVITPEELLQLDIRIQTHLLEEMANEEDLAKIRARWSGLNKAQQAQPGLVRLYASLLSSRGHGNEVVELIRQTIEQQWNEELVRLFGQLETSDPTRLLAMAEEWLVDRPSNSVLLLSLGRLALRGRFWGKAKNYLEASIGVNPSPEAYRELGALLERLDEEAKAAECYKKGLELATQGKSPSSMPVPELLGSRSLITKVSKGAEITDPMLPLPKGSLAP